MKQSAGMVRSLPLAAAALAWAVLTPALAAGWVPVLKDTPFQYFDDDDLRLFLDASRKALNDAPVNEVVSFQNPATKHRGDLTVLKIFDNQGRSCKQVRVRSEAQGRKGDNTVNACQVEGKWRLMSPSQLKQK